MELDLTPLQRSAGPGFGKLSFARIARTAPRIAVQHSFKAVLQHSQIRQQIEGAKTLEKATQPDPPANPTFTSANLLVPSGVQEPKIAELSEADFLEVGGAMSAPTFGVGCKLAHNHCVYGEDLEATPDFLFAPIPTEGQECEYFLETPKQICNIMQTVSQRAT